MAEFSKRRGDTWIFDLPLTRPNEVQIIIEGAPTNGTWTADVTTQDGRTLTTGPIAHNANAAAVETALEGVANVDDGDVTVTGGPGPGTPWTVAIAATGLTIDAVQGSFTGGSNVSIRAQSQPYDLTGATVYVTFKVNTGAADTADGVFQYHWIDGGSSDGITVADPTTGRAVLTIPSSESDDYLTTQVYSYDVQVSDATGETYTPDSGTLRVTVDVTRTVPV